MTVTEESAVPSRRRGFFSSLLLWLMVLAALGISGYTAWQVLYVKSGESQHDQVNVDQQLENQKALVNAIERDLDKNASEVAERLVQFELSLLTLKSQLTSNLRELRSDSTESTRAWRVAEVEYLLRVANYQVTLLGDHVSALATLETADVILRDLNDLTLAYVRENIAQEMQLLKNVQFTDVQGLYFQLEALKSNFRSMRFKLPEFIRDTNQLVVDATDDSNVADNTDTWWESLFDELSSLVKVRHHQSEVQRPLLSAVDVLVVKERLILAMEKAQFALLHEESAIFAQTLVEASELVATHAETTDHSTEQTLDTLKRLSTNSLDFQLPDISGSLDAIHDLSRQDEQTVPTANSGQAVSE